MKCKSKQKPQLTFRKKDTTRVYLPEVSEYILESYFYSLIEMEQGTHVLKGKKIISG